VSDQPPLRAVVGTHVELELVDEQGAAERLAFDLVPDDAADVEAGRLGIDTPLAKAIRGKAAGATLPYRMGDIRSVRLLRVAPAAAPPPEGESAEERRKRVLDEARRKAERTQAEIFASTFTSKWGGYDAEAMDD
jgi:hypothetical protein